MRSFGLPRVQIVECKEHEIPEFPLNFIAPSQPVNDYRPLTINDIGQVTRHEQVDYIEIPVWKGTEENIVKYINTIITNMTEREIELWLQGRRQIMVVKKLDMYGAALL